MVGRGIERAGYEGAAMTIAQRILEVLKERSDGVDDDELAEILHLKARQQANSRCRALEQEGVVSRRRVDGKIRNFLISSAPTTAVRETAALLEGDKPWFWEGKVQSQIVRYLSAQQYDIRSVADTAGRQRGIDIVAERDGEELWVSVKGYPEGTAKTNASLQAGHWFKQVIYDMIRYRGESDSVSLRVGLPDFSRYRSMAEQIEWFKVAARFHYYWVREDGDVTEK